VACPNLSSVLQINEQLMSHREKGHPQETHLNGPKTVVITFLTEDVNLISLAGKVMGVATSVMFFRVWISRN
jgi:hypothetical protein